MTQTELNNLQEAFVLTNGFFIEVTLAMLLFMALIIAIFWLFRPVKWYS